MANTTNPSSIRSQLTEKFNALSILKRDRATALYHFCAVLEMSENPYIVHPDLVMARGRRAVEASMRAIPAIFLKCPIAPVTPPVRFSPTTFDEAVKLVEFAFHYDQIMYCFELADRGQYTVRYDPLAQCTVFSYASHDESAADTLLRSHERDSQIENATEADKAVISQIAQEAKQELEQTILFVATDAISYPFSPKLLAVAKRWSGVLVRARRWEFPQNLAIGDLTFDDVRKFWGAVAVIGSIHEMAHLIVAHGEANDRPRGSIIAVRSRDEWSELVRDIAGISAVAASQLVWWYTFDLRVSEVCAPIQPFLEILPNYLTVPMILIATSNVERNLQKLLSRHPNLRPFYDQIKGEKEKIALAHLSSLFPDVSFAVRPTVIIKGVTDADLVVFERASGFVLVIQHKWLIAPETVSESSTNDEQLSEGATQAVEARDALRKDHDLIRRALGLAADQMIDRIEAVVICRGAEQTGFLGTLAVPLVLEQTFEELWELSSLSLFDLWESLVTRPDHSRAANRYQDKLARVVIGGLSFAFPALSIEVRL